MSVCRPLDKRAPPRSYVVSLSNPVLRDFSQQTWQKSAGTAPRSNRMPPSRDEGILFCARRAGAVVSPAREIFPCKKSTVRLKSGNMAVHSGQWIVDNGNRRAGLRIFTLSPCHQVTLPALSLPNRPNRVTPTPPPGHSGTSGTPPTPLGCIRLHFGACKARGRAGAGGTGQMERPGLGGRWPKWHEKIYTESHSAGPSSDFYRQRCNFFGTFGAFFRRGREAKPRYSAGNAGGVGAGRGGGLGVSAGR